MGQKLAVVEKAILPSAFVSSISMGPIAIEKKMLKDGTYSMSQQGQAGEADAEDKEEINEDAAVFTDAYLLKQTGYKFDVTGIEQVDGKDAYGVSVKTTAGREYTNYYDVATGLKVKSMKQADGGPMGKVTVQTYYTEYKPYNGIQVPTHMVIDQGPIKIDVKFTEVKINSGLTPEDIK